MNKNKVGRSKTGLPTVSESGGGATNTGGCRIICGANGERIRPLFVPRGYAQGEHAVFVAKVGLHIIEQSHSRAGETLTVWRITGIGGKVSRLVTREEIFKKKYGDSSSPLPGETYQGYSEDDLVRLFGAASPFVEEYDPDTLELIEVGEWENGDGNIPEFLGNAAKAASEKGRCYHCREAHYVS